MRNSHLTLIPIYFRLGTLIGLICVSVSIFLGMGHAVLSLLNPTSGKSALAAIVGGFSSAFYVSFHFDKSRSKAESGYSFKSAGIGIPALIFV